MVSRARRWVSGLVCVGLAAAAGPALADAGKLADSPQYAAWAKFKPGTSTTMSAEMDMGQMGKMTIVLTHTLESVTPDEVKLTVATAVTMMGRAQPPHTQEQTLSAKTTEQQMKPTGTADVSAMGKSFTCKVYEVTGGSTAVPPGRGGVAAPTGGKATIYVSDDVPGGAVKLVVDSPMGKPMTFLVTAMDVK